MTPNSNDLIKKRRGPDQSFWYVVAHATDMTSASIPAGLLRTANIPVYLYREAIGSALPLSVGKMGGVDITVPEAYYAEAMALLDSDDTAFDELPAPDNNIDGDIDDTIIDDSASERD